MNASTLFRSLACVGFVVLLLSPVTCENFPFPGEPRASNCLSVSVNIEKLPVMAPFDLYRFTLNMQNRGPASLDLYFPSGQAYDFIVYDRQCKVLWQWSWDKAFTQSPWTMRLRPGEEKSCSETWRPLKMASVPYRLVGRVVSTPGGEAEQFFK